VCTAINKTNNKGASQISSPLLNVDGSIDALEAGADSRLAQALEARIEVCVVGNGTFGGGSSHLSDKYTNPAATQP